jgi:hypothetical protein
VAFAVAEEDADGRVADDGGAGFSVEEVADALGDHPHRHIELPHLAVAIPEELLARIIGAELLVALDQRAALLLRGAVGVDLDAN